MASATVFKGLKGVISSRPQLLRLADIFENIGNFKEEPAKTFFIVLAKGGQCPALRKGG